MGEFDLIARYFNRHQSAENDVILAGGDDCAIIEVQPNQHIVVTTDTLVCGTHFLPTISPQDLAYKTVAVNLSDIASMGAIPRWVSLAITLPEMNTQWLTEFSDSLFHILDDYNVRLIGGDTTKGTLSLTLTAQGIVEKGQALCRHNAQLGDLIYVSGTLGDSGAGLKLLLENQAIQNDAQRFLLQRHLRPTPRIALGQAIRPFANSAIDISDGLLADLGHILQRSQCGAEIFVDNLPLSAELRHCYSQAEAEQFALSGGEDYEICFTVPPEHRLSLENRLKETGLVATCIGRIVENGLSLIKQGQPMPLPQTIGFDHFN